MILGNSLDCMVIVQYPDLQLTQLKALPKIPKKDLFISMRILLHTSLLVILLLMLSINFLQLFFLLFPIIRLAIALAF